MTTTPSYDSLRGGKSAPVVPEARIVYVDTVEVRDIIAVWPELEGLYESGRELGEAIREGAKLARQEDAYVALRGALKINTEKKED